MLSAARISIWFFIGISLLVNGGLILAAGIYELISPPQHPVTLFFNLHAGIWWGGLLFLLGIFYSYHFAPSRAGEKQGSSPNTSGGTRA